MTKRTAIKTTIPEIVDYWFSRVYEGDLSVDASEAHERCRRCGYQTKLERCHIIPHSRGGADEPSNLVLLCKKCHLENPNVSDPEIMWDWLKAYRTSLYNTFGIIQGFEEYKKIYGVSFSEQVMKLGISKVEELEPLIASKMEGCTRHFGESHLNKATFAGILRMIYKEIVKDRPKT